MSDSEARKVDPELSRKRAEAGRKGGFAKAEKKKDGKAGKPEPEPEPGAAAPERLLAPVEGMSDTDIALAALRGLVMNGEAEHVIVAAAKALLSYAIETAAEPERQGPRKVITYERLPDSGLIAVEPTTSTGESLFDGDDALLRNDPRYAVIQIVPQSNVLEEDEWERGADVRNGA